MQISAKIRKSAKSIALGLATSRGSSRPDALSATALRMMKIGLGPGLASGYENGSKAACCISIDFDVTRPGRQVPNHQGTAALLGLSEDYGIPLTWAICGMTAEEDPKAYNSILDSQVKQEIGVHTYSHIYADKESEAAYESDIEKCLAVLDLPSPPTTFVFPKNREGHFGLLKRMGFTSYRGALRAVGAPVQRSGLWNIRPVYYVDQKSLHSAALVRRFIDLCIARSGVFHLWTHPWGLAIGDGTNLMVSGLMNPVFRCLDDRRSSGLLSVTTMGGIASFLSSRTNPHIGVGTT